MTVTHAKAPLRRGERTAYLVNAGLAWFGVVLTTILSVLDQYDRSPPEPGLYGDTAPGTAGALARLVDTLSYFTIWSNIVVAIALTLLARAPRDDGYWRRVLRLDSVVMITITAIVYAVLLAPITDVTGWSRLTNPWQHILVPAVTVLVWLWFGPRGWINVRVVLGGLLIPLAWIGWMLARGAVIESYPYAFANVEEFGYPAVFTTLAGILVFAVVVMAAYWALDRLISRGVRDG
ncbi:MAG: Pr6Pr family membrane protein [Dermatophilaceae bacterium]|nr:Pr6Pr family membrane protein [Intrasporangiaceae bacterium]